MYESPINVYFKQAQEAARKVDEEVGNQIMIAVWDVGVNVNRDELIKALQYDRGQYEKGYQDGYAVTRAEIERLEEQNKNLTITLCKKARKESKAVRELIRTEAIKEFKEKLWAKLCTRVTPPFVFNFINAVKKEMEEENG